MTEHRPADDKATEKLWSAELRDIRQGLANTESIEDILARLDELADAIDPPSSIVTDEMVDEVLDSMPQNLRSRTIVRAVLEAVERLGWLRDLESAADNPSSSEPWPTDEQVLAAAKALYASVKNPLPWESDKEWWIGRARTALEAVAPPPVLDQLAGASVNHVARLTKRLEMAEGLLRRATQTTVVGGRFLALYELTAAEAEYLRSLVGEGGSDE